MRARSASQVVEQEEFGPTREPPQPASVDLGLHIGNGVRLYAAGDTEDDVPHRLNVYITDNPSDCSVAPER